MLEGAEEKLLKKQKNIEEFFKAVEYGKYLKCEEIIKKTKLKQKIVLVNSMRSYYIGECAPLHIAVEKDNVHIAHLLLSEGAFVDVQSKGGNYTPFHMVRSKEMVKLLLNYKATLTSGDWQGHTPLYHLLFRFPHDYNFNRKTFSSEERYAIAHYVLKKYPVVNNVEEHTASTLLHYAVERSEPSTISLLLDHHANVANKDKEGLTVYDKNRRAFFKKEENYFKECGIFITKRDIVDLLDEDALGFKKIIAMEDNIYFRLECQYKIKNIAELLQWIHQRFFFAHQPLNERKPITRFHSESLYSFNNSTMQNFYDWKGESVIQWIHQWFNSVSKNAVEVLKNDRKKLYKFIRRNPFVLFYNQQCVFELGDILIAKKKNKMFSYLLQEGLAFECCDGATGNTLLHSAIERQNIPVIELLLEKGLLIKPNNKEVTPIEYAQTLGYAECIIALYNSFLKKLYTLHSYECKEYAYFKAFFQKYFDMKFLEENPVPFELPNKKTSVEIIDIKNARNGSIQKILHYLYAKNNSEQACCICFELPPQYRYIPCVNKHEELLCKKCYEGIGSKECPLCRTKMNIYGV